MSSNQIRDKRRGYKKYPPPERTQGWDTSSVFHGSTLVAAQSRLPLIDAVTGAPGVAFPHTRLRSGGTSGRGTGPFQQGWPLSGNLSGQAYLHRCLCLKLSTFLRQCQWLPAEILGKCRHFGFHNTMVTVKTKRLHNSTEYVTKCNYLTAEFWETRQMPTKYHRSSLHNFTINNANKYRNLVSF